MTNTIDQVTFEPLDMEIYKKYIIDNEMMSDEDFNNYLKPTNHEISIDTVEFGDISDFKINY